MVRYFSLAGSLWKILGELLASKQGFGGEVLKFAQKGGFGDGPAPRFWGWLGGRGAGGTEGEVLGVVERARSGNKVLEAKFLEVV